MKGLFLFNTGLQAEGLACCKEAISINLKSELVWHSYGLMHRSLRDYREAVRCYNQALRIQPNNQQILRDLAVLQLQTRDFAGHAKTRFRLLKDKNKVINNWVGYAVALHLKGDHDAALQSLAYIELYSTDAQLKPQEQNELAMFRWELLLALGRAKEALEAMHACTPTFLDKVALNEFKHRAASSLGDVAQAKEALAFLLSVMPNNLQYLKLLEELELGKEATAEQRFNFYAQRDKSSAASWHKMLFVEDKTAFKR
jgi:N-alpha-acetyltransferase 15/16, NatA auxiliary subunit